MEVGTIQTIHDKVCTSLVQLVFYKPNKPSEIQYVIPGGIISSDDDYCYIIAMMLPEFRNKKSGNDTFEVIFPDKTKTILRMDDIKTNSRLIAFYVDSSATIKSLEFSREEALMNEEVFTVGFETWMPMPSHISPGRVTNVLYGYFSHDSPPYPNTAIGDFVFNKEAEIVGICFKDRGVTIAMNVETITKLLSGFHDDMLDKPLSEILQAIENQAKTREKK